MWAQLAMAGLKSFADNQANKQNIASNVITQKYAPWTGQRADFSAQGKNSTISNLIAGYGSGMLQDKLDAQETADKVAEAQTAQNAESKSDHDFYSKLSANPASVGVSPIASNKGSNSAFAAVANQPQRAPAFDPMAQSPLPQQGPSMDEQARMFAQNPWALLAGRR